MAPVALTRETRILDLPLSTRVRRAIVNYLVEWHAAEDDAPFCAMELLSARELRYLIPNLGPKSVAEIAEFLGGPAKGIVSVEGFEG